MAEQGIFMALVGFLGVLVGAFLSVYTWRKSAQANNARELLSDALLIQAQKEAWILEGPGYQKENLSKNKGLPTEPQDTGLWLRNVEVRFVLDNLEWKSPEQQRYCVIEGRRTWIVRDKICGLRPAYLGASPDDCYPALLSSKAFEELSGWIERVSSAKKWGVLDRHGVEMLRPLLDAVCTEDRIEVFGENRLSDTARKFLRGHRKKYFNNTVEHKFVERDTEGTER